MAPAGSAGGNGSATLTPLYVKMAVCSGAACQSPAVAEAAVNGTTSSYTLTALDAGIYCGVMTNSAALANIAAYVPSGRLGTQNAGGSWAAAPETPAVSLPVRRSRSRLPRAPRIRASPSALRHRGAQVTVTYQVTVAQ